MDPGSFLFLFMVVWLIRGAWDGKVAEFRASQAHVREQVDQRHPHAPKERREQMVRNAARRNTIGFGLYQLRHGWPALWTAVADGWDDARRGHQEWLDRREQAGEPRRPGWRETVREAWRRRRNTPEAETTEPESGEAKPTPRPEPPKPSGGGKPAPEPQQPPTPATTGGRPAGPPPIPEPVVPHLRPVPQQRPTGGSMEAPNLDAARQAITAAASSAGAITSGLEQVIADMIAGGMSNDQQTMSRIAAMQEALNDAQAYGSAAVASMGRHASGQEYADTGHAARTEYLKTS